jgi:hypothetical protein
VKRKTPALLELMDATLASLKPIDVRKATREIDHLLRETAEIWRDQ